MTPNERTNARTDTDSTADADPVAPPIDETRDYYMPKCATLRLQRGSDDRLAVSLFEHGDRLFTIETGRAFYRNPEERTRLLDRAERAAYHRSKTTGERLRDSLDKLLSATYERAADLDTTPPRETQQPARVGYNEVAP